MAAVAMGRVMTTVRDNTTEHNEPGNRQERRARKSRVARFGRGRKVVETALIGVNEIDQHPRAELLRRAARFWRSSGSSTCFACEAPTPHPSAFLFGWSAARPKQAAVAGLCCDCWRGDDAAAIDEAAVRVLQQLVPVGVFLDPVEVQS